MNKEDLLLHYLKTSCVGHKNIRSRAQLQRMLQISRKRLTELVHRLRCQGEPIAGGSGGYFYAENAGELYETVQWLRRHVTATQNAIGGLVESMGHFGGGASG